MWVAEAEGFEPYSAVSTYRWSLGYGSLTCGFDVPVLTVGDHSDPPVSVAGRTQRGPGLLELGL